MYDSAAHLQIDKRWLDLVQHEELTLLLDFDGTLVPFAPTAEEALLDDVVADVLAQLRRAGVHVIIVSGRPRRLLAPFQTRCSGLWWAAEHGSWRCDHSGDWQGPTAAREVDELEQLLAPFLSVEGLRLERKSLSICLHWRQCPEPRKASVIAAAERACDEWLVTHGDFERIAGVEMLEVRRRAANKGTAVAWARERMPGARLIAIGDDVTDEDMFAALREDELAIGVGPRKSTRCAFSVPGPTAVHALLRSIAELRMLRASARVAQTAQAPVTADAAVAANRVAPPPPPIDPDALDG